VTVLVGGCAPSSIYLRPEKPELIVRAGYRAGRGCVAARVQVPDGVPGGLDVTVSSRGAFVREHDDETCVLVEVEVEIENRSESKPAGFYADATRLRTSQGLDLKPADAIEAPSSSDATASILLPGERRHFDLVFRANGVDDPRDVAPARLRLLFSYQRIDYPETVLLIRYYPERYRYGYPYGYYGAGYPYGYYGPYYGPLFW
jgi:hypothetical protein